MVKLPVIPSVGSLVYLDTQGVLKIGRRGVEFCEVVRLLDAGGDERALQEDLGLSYIEAQEAVHHWTQAQRPLQLYANALEINRRMRRNPPPPRPEEKVDLLTSAASLVGAAVLGCGLGWVLSWLVMG